MLVWCCCARRTYPGDSTHAQHLNWLSSHNLWNASTTEIWWNTTPVCLECIYRHIAHVVHNLKTLESCTVVNSFVSAAPLLWYRLYHIMFLYERKQIYCNKALPGDWIISVSPQETAFFLFLSFFFEILVIVNFPIILTVLPCCSEIG